MVSGTLMHTMGSLADDVLTVGDLVSLVVLCVPKIAGCRLNAVLRGEPLFLLAELHDLILVKRSVLVSLMTDSGHAVSLMPALLLGLCGRPYQ